MRMRMRMEPPPLSAAVLSLSVPARSAPAVTFPNYFSKSTCNNLFSEKQNMFSRIFFNVCFKFVRVIIQYIQYIEEDLRKAFFLLQK